jgi:hypothetical protein
MSESIVTTEHRPSLTRGELLLLVGLFLAVFATRLPWLATDYGTDPDSYRVILAARHIADTGDYRPSRTPGHPLHEYMIASVVNLGPVLTNGISAVSSCVAVLFFALILRQLRVRGYLFVAGAFALVPVVFVNSTHTIDYIPALALILASTYFVLVKRPLTAGISLGLAIGCRLTSGAMLLPLSLWALLEGDRDRRTREVIVFAGTTLVVGSIVFIPVVLTRGFGVFTFADWQVYPPLQRTLGLAFQGVWGHSATSVIAALVVLILFSAGSIRRALRGPRTRRALPSGIGHCHRTLCHCVSPIASRVRLLATHRAIRAAHGRSNHTASRCGDRRHMLHAGILDPDR